MGRNGESGAKISECCMCGDYGLSSHLFICQHCKSRSQHKYCSNLYPLAESYHICNWCLSQKEDKKTADQVNNNNMIITKTSPRYSSHHRKENDVIVKTNKKKRVLARDRHGGFIKEKKTSSGEQIIKMKPVDDRPGPSAGGPNNSRWSGKRIIRRTRSDEISNGGGIVVKQVFRNKVRRYKHLDEVSC